MISYDEAKKSALNYMDDGLEISSAYVLPDKWVFGFQDAATKDVPDISTVYVMKEDGRVGVFFPPDHIAELPQMKRIEV